MKAVDLKYLETHKGKLAIVFSAPWCKPCQAMKPNIEKLEPEFPDVEFVVIDVDANPDAASLGIRGVPTVMFTSGGAEIDRITGNVPMSKFRDILVKM